MQFQNLLGELSRCADRFLYEASKYGEVCTTKLLVMIGPVLLEVQNLERFAFPLVVMVGSRDFHSIMPMAFKILPELTITVR